MRSSFLWRSLPPAAAAALAASLTVAAPLPAAMADSLIAPSPVAAGQAAPGAPARVSRPVLLMTGARLAVQAGPGGRPVTLLVPPSSAPAGRTAILTMGRPGHVSEVPVDALPFLGRGLDPGLFSVAALQRAEHGAGCRCGSATGGGCRPCRA